MHPRSAILCPIDFSDASAGAVRYARAIAEHFGVRLILLAVEDPLLAEAIDLGTATIYDPSDTRRDLEHFASAALQGEVPKGIAVEYRTVVGKPASQILQAAHEEGCDLIVMSTHGLTGMRKLFFGSTTERVLRDTIVPVLATPPSDDGPVNLEDARRIIGRILVPVDLTRASLHQVQVARGLASGLGIPFIVTHVVEPVRSPRAARLHLPSIETERRARAESTLNELLATVPRQLHPEALVAYGDPAEEIARIARDRQAGLIVMGLHGSPLLGPRMGSVTYRVLCLAHTLVLALPPAVLADAAQPAVARGVITK